MTRHVISTIYQKGDMSIEKEVYNERKRSRRDFVVILPNLYKERRIKNEKNMSAHSI